MSLRKEGCGYTHMDVAMRRSDGRATQEIKPSDSVAQRAEAVSGYVRWGTR